MLTYNIKLKFEDNNQEQYWLNMLSMALSCYNDVSTLIWDNPSVKLGLKTVHALVYNEMREKYPTIPSQMVIKIYKSVIASYRSNKRKFKCIKKQLNCQLDKRLYSKLTPTSITLGTEKSNCRRQVNFILYDKFKDLASKYTMKDPNMFSDGKDIWLGIPFDVTKLPVLEETYLGIDLGVRRLVTTSDGIVIDNKPLKKLKRRIRKLKRELQSKKSKAAKEHLRKIRNREVNLNKFYCHDIANKILNTDKTILVLEDLTKLKQKTSRAKEGYKRKKHNNRMSQVPFYKLKEILTYKAQLLGKRVETVSPHNTSKLNCMTNKLDGERKGCRYYTPSGVILDADWNAAINIMNRKHPSPFELPIDGSLNFDGRVPVNHPNLENNLLSTKKVLDL